MIRPTLAGAGRLDVGGESTLGCEGGRLALGSPPPKQAESSRHSAVAPRTMAEDPRDASGALMAAESHKERIGGGVRYARAPLDSIRRWMPRTTPSRPG